MRPHEEHHRHAGKPKLGFAVLTISDSRSGPTDTGGALLAQLVESGGHAVARRARVRDELVSIGAGFQEALLDDGVDVVVSTGGTGIAPRDLTPEALRPMLDKELPGFGEAFRMLSFQEIGGAALASRALAGVRSGKLLVALPGSPDAVRLAMERLVLPEAAHLLSQARRSA